MVRSEKHDRGCYSETAGNSNVKFLRSDGKSADKHPNRRGTKSSSSHDTPTSSRKSIRKSRKFKISDRPRKKAPQYLLMSQHKEAIDSSSIDTHSLLFFLSSFIPRLILQLLELSFVLLYSQFCRAFTSLPPEKNEKMKPFRKIKIHYKTKTIHRPSCENEKISSTLRAPDSSYIWCSVWVILGILSKETAITSLGVCFTWDLYNYHSQRIR